MYTRPIINIMESLNKFIDTKVIPALDYPLDSYELTYDIQQSSLGVKLFFNYEDTHKEYCKNCYTPIIDRDACKTCNLTPDSELIVNKIKGKMNNLEQLRYYVNVEIQDVIIVDIDMDFNETLRLSEGVEAY